MIVVGASVAGLGAGQQLAALGLLAVMLEARDRIGGRCYCDNTFPVPSLDLGVQVFHQVVPNANSDPFMLDSYSAARGGKAAARATFPETLDNRIYFAGEVIFPTRTARCMALN